MLPPLSHPWVSPMNEAYLRPRTILETFGRLYPDAWKQVDDLRANRKGFGGWPDWCFPARRIGTRTGSGVGTSRRPGL